jgi:hypothetical protein
MAPQAAFFCFLNAAHLFRCAAAIRLRAAGDNARFAECPDLPEAGLLLTASNAAIAWLRRSRSCRSLAITASKVGIAIDYKQPDIEGAGSPTKSTDQIKRIDLSGKDSTAIHESGDAYNL